MPLTAAQLATLATDIAGNAATVPAGRPFAGTAIGALPHTADAAFEVALWYSGLAAPDYFVWRTEVPVQDVFDQITWANFTPTDAPDNTVTYQNRAVLCQTKQMNLQLMLQGRDRVDASKKNIRAGLNDATTNLPSGAAGALRSGGWAAVLTVLMRKALRVEKLFALDDGAGIGNTTTDPRGNSTNPDAMGHEGSLDAADVRAAWGI